jgi:hypothetical protein
VNLETTYEVVKERYPEAVATAVARLRKGKSKHKDAPEENLTWSFDWSIRIDGMMNGVQFFESLKTGGPPKPPEFDTFEEYWADYETSVSVCLRAKIGRWQGCSEILPKVPNEIKEHQRPYWEKDKADKARIASLSPEEREAEVQECLRKLSGNPGFACVQVSIDPVTAQNILDADKKHVKSYAQAMKDGHWAKKPE